MRHTLLIMEDKFQGWDMGKIASIYFKIWTYFNISRYIFFARRKIRLFVSVLIYSPTFTNYLTRHIPTTEYSSGQCLKKAEKWKFVSDKEETSKCNIQIFCHLYGTWTKKAFMSLYGVTSERVRRLCNLLKQKKLPSDQRGRRPSKLAISGEICKQIEDHIKSFPLKVSHYGSEQVCYLNERLVVTHAISKKF